MLVHTQICPYIHIHTQHAHTYTYTNTCIHTYHRCRKGVGLGWTGLGILEYGNSNGGNAAGGELMKMEVLEVVIKLIMRYIFIKFFSAVIAFIFLTKLRFYTTYDPQVVWKDLELQQL